ncbi:hypothetical protein BT96DRAFT_942915 [Gymnopus androsaceus JB14]|uniref:Uncharacterized protein n=1 Tax=Gymnopus androsaceus JB14 TaxID=1447944 RepID=A0A6A4HAI7_9AGAR|nr:hypothetical protein BT96DRAFT_942915 [Gymnopus androsaceus JB14]
MSRWVTSKPFVGTDDEFQPSPALSKSVNTASSSTSLRAHRRTAAVVPVIETQRALTSGQTSRLTGPGWSGLSSSTLPAARGGARGAAGPSRGSSSATPVTKPPSSLRNIVQSSNIILLPLTDFSPILADRYFPFLVRRCLAPLVLISADRILARYLCFDKHSPRMVAYKAKYGKYMVTTWSAAFLPGVQRFCTQMLGQYTRKDLKRYQTEWFIEESILTYPFIGGDEIPGLSSPIVTPSKLISGGFVNYNKFSIDFELSISGLDQGELFPKEAIFISNLVKDVGLSQVGIHGFSPSPHLFDPSEDALVDNMFINFEAIESKNEHQTDNGQEEEEDDDGQEPEEEDADHDIDVEEDPSPIDNEIEFVGEAVEQPVRIRSSMLDYPTLPVPKPVSSSTYTSKSKKGQSSRDKDSGFPRLEGGHQNTSLFGYNSVLARGVRMITERFAAPGDFNDNKHVRLHATLDSLVHSTIPLQPADKEWRRLFMHAARSNRAVAMFSSTLVEENLGLLHTEVLLWSFLTEFKIQAKMDTERLSMLAFFLGWDKCFTLEDLEFDRLLQIPLPEVVVLPPTQSQYKGKGKAKAVEAASEEGSAPEEASTVVAEPVSSSGSILDSPSKRRSPSQSPSAEEDDEPVAKRRKATKTLLLVLLRDRYSALQVLIDGSGSKQGSRKRKRPIGASTGL